MKRILLLAALALLLLLVFLATWRVAGRFLAPAPRDGAPPAAPAARPVPAPGGGSPSVAPAPEAPAAPSPDAAPAGRTVRWKVEPGECPVPPDGSVIRVGRVNAAPDREGRMAGDTLVVEGLPPQYGVYRATAEDGSLASLFLPPAGTDPWEAVSFLRPRKVVITLRDEFGDPVEAAGVGLGSHGRDRQAKVVPLAGGRAVYDGLYPSTAGEGFWLVDDFNRDGDGTLLGTVDVSQGDGTLERVVARARDVAIRFLVDGEARVPTNYHLLAENQAVFEPGVDAAAGEVRFRMRPAFAGRRTLRLHFGSPGYRPDQVALDAAWDGAGNVFRATLELAAAPDLVLAGLVRGGTAATVTCLDARSGDGWSCVAAGIPLTPEGTFRRGGLGPGAYRLRDAASGVAGEPVDLAPGMKTPEALLEVPAVAAARGRVAAPPYALWRDVRILVEGPGVDTSWRDPMLHLPGFPVRGDLTFEVPVPADRTVALRAWHPVLASPRDGAPPATRGAVEGLVLPLAEERVAVFRPEPEGVGSGWFRVLLFAGEAKGEPVAERRVVVTDGVARFGGFEPGRYTLWFDTWKWASRVVENVDLGEGRTDLGPVRFDPGTVLTVRLRIPDGYPWPGFDAAATPLQGPAFTRWEYANKETREAVIPGLAAGRYRVRLRMGGLMGEFTREIEVDGASPATVEMEPE